MLLPRAAKTVRLWLIACVVALAASGCGPASAPEGEDASPPDPTDQMRELWSRSAAGFLRTWLVCGEFPNPPHEGQESYDHTPPCVGLETDYLASVGGEAAVRPERGMTVERPDGTVAEWFEHTAPHNHVDFEGIFAGRPTDNVVAYAWTTVERKAAGRVLLSLGSDDGVRVWLNGRLVHDHLVGRPVRKDEDIVPVELREGTNRLLVKVEEGIGGWGFMLRILSEDQILALEPGDLRAEIVAEPEGPGGVLRVRTDSGAGARIPDPAPVTVEAVGPGGVVVARDVVRRGATVDLDPADWPDGPYEVRVSKAEPEGHTAYRHLPWYKGDWRQHAREVLDDADEAAERRDPDAMRLAVCRDLVRDRLGGDPRKSHRDPGKRANLADDAWRDIHSPLMEHREVTAGPDALVRPHGFIRLAWIDPVDGSAQYARAYLPPAYTPEKAWPLVVVLHGYNAANPEYVRWWSVMQRHDARAERHGVVLVEPHGRGNTGYCGMGRLDVLRSVERAKERFRIDPDRVYLAGYSMGGGGTWHVGTRHVNLFAAIGPIYGGWDYHAWVEADGFAELTELERYRHEAWSSFVQAESLLTTPVFVNHGDADSLVDVEHSRYIVRMLQRWGYPVRYWEHPGTGHGGLGCEDALMRFFLSHRLERHPRRVRIRQAALRTAAAHWVRIEQREDPLAMMHADARVVNRRLVRLDTDNVLAVRLSPGPALVDHGPPVRVIWNGRYAGEHVFGPAGVTLHAPGYRPAEGHKRPELAGPLWDVQHTPFAIVCGTASEDPAMARFVRMRAEAARDAWRQWQRVEPRYFLDTEITDEQVREYSLELFGGPDANRVMQRLAEKLPLALEPGGVTVGEGTFEAEDAAVVMIHPHPLDPDRYVLVRAGTSPAGMFHAAEVPEQLDFVVVDGRVGHDTPIEDLCVAAGRFDHAWRVRDEFTVLGDPEVRRVAGTNEAPKHLSAGIDATRLWISDLLETAAMGSFRQMRRDMNWDGRTIRLGGRRFTRGIAVQVWHEPCTATYDLSGGEWKRFRGTLGIEIREPEELEDQHRENTRVFFIVRGDGEELFRSRTLHWDSPPQRMDVEVTGVRKLELEVANETTWHCGATSVDWANLRLEK
jgi:dienelactone hydrolase